MSIDAMTEGLLNWLVTSGVRIVVILAAAFVLARVIDWLAPKMGQWMPEREEEHPWERNRRITTLANALTKTARWVLYLAAALVILSEIGVEIGPLLAAAGIGAVALGFGAQNLIRDLISGFFLILENQVRVGDVVEVNGTGGEVEQLNLRTIVLRDLEGTVHVFPNGAIERLANKTKDWSRAVVEVGVAQHEDVDRVMRVLSEIGVELAEDPEWRSAILAPTDVVGVISLGESSVEIRTITRTVPLRQWDVANELRRRIKYRFDEAGIETPFPYRTLTWSDQSVPLAVRLTSPDPHSDSG
jgi:small conductance mechanosensitive channel